MFATSQFGEHVIGRRVSCVPLTAGEGRDSDPSLQATRAILLPRGRPGGWLVFMLGLCGFVLLQAASATG